MDRIPGPSVAQVPPERSEVNTVIGIFCFAFALRLLNFQQIRANDPFFSMPSVDPRFYHEWATRIAEGDWLGEGVFLQGPLYPYLLGSLYTLTGPNLVIPRLLQCLLGAFTCVLVWRLARDVFDRRVALLAAGMTSIYSMSIFYEGSLLIVNILPPILLGLLIMMIRVDRQPSWKRWLWVGLLIGAATLARPNMLLYLFFAIGWLLFISWRRLAVPETLVMLIALGAGFALLVGPSALRNHAVADDWVMISASGGMNFYNGNNPAASGVHKVPPIFDRSQADDPIEQNLIYKAYAERALGRELKASEVSDYWFGRGFEYVRENPGEWAALLWKKFRLFISAHEPWNNRSIIVTRQFSWVLGLPLLTFGVMAPLALLGMLLGVKRIRALLPLYAAVGVYVATCVIFFMLSRYRQPAVPILLIFASFAVFWLVDEARERRIGTLAPALLAIAIFAWIVHQSLIQDDLSVAYYNLGNKYRLSNRPEQAIRQYDESLTINAGYISAYNNRALAIEASARPLEQKIAAWEEVLTLGRRRGLSRYVEIATRHLRSLEAGAEASD